MRTEQRIEPGYWAVLPAKVRYAQELPAAAKILYAEISSLTDARGYCFASNAYFMDLYGLTERTLQRHLDALKRGGFIRIQDGDGGSGRRKIYAGINPLVWNPDKNDGVPDHPDKNDGVTPTKMTGSNMVINKKEDQIPPKPPRGRMAKKAPDHLPEEFDRLWKAYPRGEDKQGAIAEWDRLKPDEATIFSMKAALLVQKQSEEWQRGVGIPYFVRWLRHRRWEDDRIRSATGAPLPADGRSVESPQVAQW